jgi:uncharacterized protein
MPEPDADTPERVLTYIANGLVDDQEAVEIEADHGDGSVDLRLTVGGDDMGRVIGRRGRNAQAIRTVVRAAGARAGIEASVDIVD